MHSCYYLYQIAQELKNLEPNFFVNYVIPIVSAIVPASISYLLLKQNEKLQEQLIASTQAENLRQEFLQFHEQIQATYWMLEKMFSGLPEIIGSNELKLTKSELSNKTSDLIKAAGRYAFLSGRNDIQEKTAEISREIQRLYFSIDDFLDSEDMKIIKDSDSSREGIIAQLEIDLSNHTGSINILRSISMRILSKFCEYRTSMESIGKESPHTPNK